MSEVVKNYKKIIDEISRYNKKFSSTSKNPKLIAVSKTFPETIIQEVINQGQIIFGENRVQEAVQKWTNLKKKNKKIELHLIGPLQSNKVREALNIFDVIQTIDREKVVRKIKESLEETSKKQFFVQVNIGGESQKSGVLISELNDFLDWCCNDINLKVNGLMCIPPLEKEPSYYFNLLRNLCDKHKLSHASMGMSGDFTKAIQFGATYLRVGSGIFGRRS